MPRDRTSQSFAANKVPSLQLSWTRSSIIAKGTLSRGHCGSPGEIRTPVDGSLPGLESKAHHWPGHCFRPLLVHYTTGLQETRVLGQDPISLLRHLTGYFDLLLAMGRNVADKMKKEGRGEVVGLLCYGTISIQYGIWSVTVPPVNTMSP